MGKIGGLRAARRDRKFAEFFPGLGAKKWNRDSLAPTGCAGFKAKVSLHRWAGRSARVRSPQNAISKKRPEK